MTSRGTVLSLAVLAVLAAGGLAGCDSETASELGAAKDKVTTCTTALGLADLNPLVDPDRIKQRAEDKERRLRELAEQAQAQEVRGALLNMADSYVQVQRERFDDLTVVGRWAQRNAENLDRLRRACS